MASLSPPSSRAQKHIYSRNSIVSSFFFWTVTIILTCNTLSLLPSSFSSHHGTKNENVYQPTFKFFVSAFSFPPTLKQHYHSHTIISTTPMTANMNFIEKGDHQLCVAMMSNTNIVDTATNKITKTELNKMTIKQLKTYIQENNIEIPRGEASQLKLKKQIVDFILGYYNNNDDDGSVVDDANDNDDGANAEAGDAEEVTISSERQHPQQQSKKEKLKKRPLGTGMPPLPIADANNNRDQNKPMLESITPSSSYILTPKDRIVLDVLQMYPPLHDVIVNACREEHNYDNDAKVDVEQLCDLSSFSYKVPSDIGEDDIRHLHHPLMAKAAPTDLDIVFIGTASCTPGVTRGVSCTALRLNWRSSRSDKVGADTRGGHVNGFENKGPTGGTWLFDCGEATQLSVQRTSSVKPGKISKIFITHCHGDHSFGLPGLLCLMGTDRDRDDPPIDIYGPEGLRMWLRVAIRYSVSRVVPPYRVHELMDVPLAPEWEEGHLKNGRYYFQLSRDRQNTGNAGHKKGWTGYGTRGLAGEDPVSWISRAPMINLDPSRDFSEIEGGRDIYPRYDHPNAVDGAPVWEVEDEGDVKVCAAPMSHGVPCVGYVVQEQDKPGRLRPENVTPMIKKNFDGLVKSGVRNPMKIMATIKNLPIGGSYEFPDGTVVKQKDVVEPPRKGRKIVICGDTADSRALEGLSQDADVLVHEATNTYLPGVDKDTSLRVVTKDAKVHGHSTPFMAGEFAKRINAKKLVLNHFSARYKGDQSIDSITIMTRMERQAMKASGLPEDAVACAWDYMVLPVPPTDKID